MMDESFFPHEKIRDVQQDFIEHVCSALQNKNNLIIHAPTGIGKTAASLSPALDFALKKKKNIFFLTSRHTQHYIAVETLRKIKKKNIKFICADMIGKKWMCLQPGINSLYSNDFNEYCKTIKEEGKCEFYNNTDKSTRKTVLAKSILEEITAAGPFNSEELIDICRSNKLCPYEISIMLCRKSNVVIADYYYIFNPNVKDFFLSKTNKKLENSIVIVDEAHNLAGRVRDLLTHRLTDVMVARAISEAKKNGYKETGEKLNKILGILTMFSDKLRENEECILSKSDFVDCISEAEDYNEAISTFQFIGDELRERQKISYIGSIGHFLESWLGEEEGFARILKKEKKKIILSYRCLDPSFITGGIIGNLYSTILMSGTLTPTGMYKELLGFEQAAEKELNSPFPKKNRLSIIVTKTTTKFLYRNEKQYENIAKICADITNTVQGNSLVFFPSYGLRDAVEKYFSSLGNKKIFLEDRTFNKEERNNLIQKFKKLKEEGSVLLAVAHGSFGEGVDLPGDLLKCVVVVGLPLRPPDLETKELIRYYDKKFGKGWDYGYVLPAITRCLQNAGRCIRSETDKGAIIFLDERYAWKNYYKCFPKEWDVKVSGNYLEEIKIFFGNQPI